MFFSLRGAPELRHPLKHGFSGLDGYGKDTKQHGTWASRAKLKGRRSQVIYSGLTLLMKFHQFLQDIRCGWCHLWVCKVDKIGKREREKMGWGRGSWRERGSPHVFPLRRILVSHCLVPTTLWWKEGNTVSSSRTKKTNQCPS